MRARFSILHLLAMPLLACGGGGNSNVDSSLHPLDGRGSGSGSGSGSSAACTASSSYSPTFGGSDQQASTDGSGSAQNTIQYAGKLNTDASPDLLDLELYKGFGAFTAGITPKSVTITGAEADYASCGACVLILTDLHSNGSGGAAITDSYMASGGTLNLTSTTGTLTGTLSNIQTRHVDIAQDGSGNITDPDDADGCKSDIASASFSAPIVQAGSGSGSAAFTSTPDHIHVQAVLHYRTR